MRKSLSFLAVSLMIGTVACELSTEDEDSDAGSGEGRGNGTVGDRGMGVGPADGSAVPDASKGPDGGSADAGGGSTGDAGAPVAVGGDMTLTVMTPQQCALPVATSSAACGGPDVFEPNDQKESATNVPSGCVVVPSKLTPDNYDWFQFITERADPVRVEVAYETTPTGGANINLRVVDPMGYAVASAGGNRQELVEVSTDTFESKRGFAYAVQLYDNANKGCQGYNLRVDPNFCTDSFEDNDSADKAAKGLAYGTKLEATVFNNDQDWYDLSAIQANGASCVLTSALTLSSPATLNFRFQAANGNNVVASELTGTAATKTVTLPAGSPAAALEVYSNENVCSSYSVTCTPL